MAEIYPWVKAFHVAAVIAWMAGMLYLPRLFVYHADAAAGSELAETLAVMERRLQLGIMGPAMGATWLLGIAMIAIEPGWLRQGWLHVKLAGVIALSAGHGIMGRWRRDLATGANRRSARFFRIANEVPALIILVIVVMVIVKPF